MYIYVINFIFVVKNIYEVMRTLRKRKKQLKSVTDKFSLNAYKEEKNEKRKCIFKV